MWQHADRLRANQDRDAVRRREEPFRRRPGSAHRSPRRNARPRAGASRISSQPGRPHDKNAARMSSAARPCAGPGYAKSRADAGRILTELHGQKIQGGLAAPTHSTVGEYMHAWLEDSKRPNVRPTTYRGFESHPLRHPVCCCRDFPLVPRIQHEKFPRFRGVLAVGLSRTRTGDRGFGASKAQQPAFFSVGKLDGSDSLQIRLGVLRVRMRLAPPTKRRPRRTRDRNRAPPGPSLQELR